MSANLAYRPTPLVFERLELPEQRARLRALRERMLSRRTVRHYSSEPVPDELIDEAIAIAASAPSGANLQPWRFVVVHDPEVKRLIRLAAEEEERLFYEQRAPQELCVVKTDVQPKSHCVRFAPKRRRLSASPRSPVSGVRPPSVAGTVGPQQRDVLIGL